MADRSITELNELLGSDIDLDSDQLEIVDVSEAQAADKNKRFSLRGPLNKWAESPGPIGQTTPDKGTFTDLSDDRGPLPAQLNPKALSQAIHMTAASSGSNGIKVLDSDEYDLGTGDFTLHWEGALPDYSPSSVVWLKYKLQTTNTRWIFQLRSGGGQLSFFASVGGTKIINETTDQAVSVVGGDNASFSVSVVRETENADGEAKFYANGELLDTQSIPSAPTVDISNPGSLFLLGNDSIREAGINGSDISYNRALTASEVLDLHNNGVSFADKWGSQTPVIGPTDYSSGTDNWGGDAGATITGNVDGVGGKDDTLKVESDGTSATNAFIGVTINEGKRARYSFDIYVPSSNATVTGIRVECRTSGTNVFENYQIPADTWTTVEAEKEFIDEEVNRFRIYHADQNNNITNNTAGDVFHIASGGTFKQIGATLALEPESIQPAPGQWLDSAHGNHALMPPEGATLTRPQPTGILRWQHSWSGTSETQYVGGTNQAVFEVKHALDTIDIDSDTAFDINIGDGSNGTRYGSAISLSSGKNRVTLATPFNDGSNLKLTVTPTTSVTADIKVTARYSELEV